MSWSLQDCQNQIASELDQSATAPASSSSDWLIRLNALNRANLDWANTSEWECLKKVHNGRVSLAGGASYILPVDFAKLDGFPIIMWDGSTANEFPVIDASKNSLHDESEKFVNIFDNMKDTKVMFIHANTLSSGASVQFTYYKSTATLSTASDVIECPDPTFLVQRALYYLYKSREDGRFPEAKVESDKILARMLENEASKGLAYEDRRIPNWNEERYSFRIGRDG
jgi:hypothetical protein